MLNYDCECNDGFVCLVCMLRKAIKDHHELIHSSPYGHVASVNVLYYTAFPGAD